MQHEILTVLMLYQQIGQVSQLYPGVKILIGSLIPTPKSGTIKLDSAFNQMEVLSKHVIKREHFIFKNLQNFLTFADTTTVNICILNLSGIQMADFLLCQVIKWSGIQMVNCNWTEKACLRSKCRIFKWSAKACDITI